ncbi:RES family NAD+ phosphorylase [Duganella vulcania]|uniref:RES domain-containing protein n=1 Tax=Duganella vulcania TaxID=2692166 RepID=A0A845GHZ3_9BURK|nr:RES family NAD+ phosphorylase [Duganella vulcania]MYM92668.1 RES domain-containing protein [Duganella vulcania]
MSSGWDFVKARNNGSLRIVDIETTDLLRLTRFPATEPYWGKGKAYRFDDPAQVFGVTYAAFTIDVAFSETILHQKGCFIDNQWMINESNVMERSVVTYTRPGNQSLKIAELTGKSLKAIGLNNDICSSDDYTTSMAISSALHAQLHDVDGILYVSRQMNTDLAVALFERSNVQVDGNATKFIDHADFDALLKSFNVTILPSGKAP